MLKMDEKLCWESSSAVPGPKITLVQEVRGTFAVQYGVSTHGGLNFDKAAQEIGYCIMHALSGEGLVDRARAYRGGKR